MDFVQGIVKRIPSTPNIPSLNDFKGDNGRGLPQLSFFRRRIRIKGNSSISIPLGFVLLFPCIVVILILFLFVRHPSSSGRILMPSGAPPSIRFVSKILSPLAISKLTLAQENQRKT